MAKGRQVGGLYKLEANQATEHQGNQATGYQVQQEVQEKSQDKHGDKENQPKKSKDEDYSIWHARLGHSSMTKLAHITCIKEHVNKENTSCEACILAKFHRQPFSVSDSMATMAFELVHMDLWGPYRVPDLTGASYFLTVVDDHTRCTWVYLLQNKMQVPTHVQNFIAYVQNQFRGQIKCK